MFKATVTEGVFGGLINVMTRSCFGVILQHKVNGCKWRLSLGDT